jgi:ABC-2 type transport system permease protein
MERIRTIIDKEWAEVFKNKAVMMTIVVMPVVFTVLPLLVLFFTKSGMNTGDTTDMPAQFARTCQDLSMADCMQVYILNQFLLMFMVMPLAIPIAIAAYSIVGEKTTRSLEPLLATPITTEELLAGKCLAAAIPAILATLGAVGVFLLLAPLTGASPAVRSYILSPTWITAVFLVGPLMAVAAVNLAVIVSSRVNDPRAAEQISAVFLVPLLGIMFAQIAGLIVVNLYLMLVVAVTLLVIDIGLIYIGAELFQREAILTRWK